MLRKVIFILIIPLIFLTAFAQAQTHESCEGHEHAHQKKPAQDHEHDHDLAADVSDHDEGIIEMDSARIALSGIKISTIRGGSINKEIKLSGEVQVNEDSLIHHVARASGILVQVNVSAGDYVRKNQVLAVIDSAQLGQAKSDFYEIFNDIGINAFEMGRFEKVAENSQQLIRALDKNPDISRIKDLGAGDMADYGSELLKSYVEFIVSTKSFERKKRLRDDKIVSESEFLIAQNNFEKASANFAAARNNIKFELRQKRFDFKKKLKNLAFRLRIAELQLKMLGLTEKEIDQIRKQGTELSGDCNDERCDLSVVSPNGHIHQFGNADFSRLVIRADRSGTIIFRNAVVGEEAEQNRILFSIADLSSLWAVLQMPGRDYNMVKPGMEVEILSSDKISSIGRVLLVHPVMDEKTRSVAVRVALNNESKDWIPNSFITGKISISAENVAVLLKRNAVQTVNGEKVVFVPVNQGFKAVDVTTGRQDRENIEILSGIKPGEKFVSEGAFALKSIMVTSGMDPHAGHGH